MEQKALERLYAQYQRELYLYLYALCHDREQAEDLLQETFLKALLALPDGHTNMRAWLYLVARNLYYNQWKRDQRTVPVADRAVEDASEDVLDRLLRSETQRTLYAALAKLEPRRREVLLLQYFGELSQREIAAVLRITPEHVRVLAYRARKELKQYLEGSEQ